jgi:GAF domain-containing protein
MSETVDTARQDLLRTVAAGTAGVVGEEFLQRLVQAVGETFGGGVCWISELSDSGQTARRWPRGRPRRCPLAASTSSTARPAGCCTSARW